MLLCLTTVVTACAQGNILTREANLLCDSDELIIQSVPYFYSIGNGEGYTWNFTGIDSNGKYKVFHERDSLRVILSLSDHGITYYQSNNDTLYIIGRESPLCKAVYDVPQMVMRYPFAYGDSISKPFSGNGIYCGDHYFRERGSSTITADAAGEAVIGGDTIPNVLRVCTLKSYSVCMDVDSTALDTAKLKQVIEERYDWYARGYRYPILTTLTSTSYDNTVPIGTVQRSYCMLPDVQNLQDDPYNIDIRRKDSIDNARRDLANADIFHYSVNQHGGQIIVNYSLDSDADITALVSDVMGITYKRSRFHNVKGDGYTMSIDCSDLQYGQYILYMNVNGKVYSRNITIGQ